MAYLDRVGGTTTGTGTGNLTLAAATGLRLPGAAFAANTSGVTLVIIDRTTGDFEVASCTVIDGTAVRRDAVLSSSNGGSAVSFSAGVKDVYHDVPAAIINDLLDNRLLSATPITSGLAPDTDQLALVVGGSVRRMSVADFVADIGQATTQLPAAGSISGADIIAITQDGANEVKTTVSALATYIAALIGGNALAPGASIVATASVTGGAATGGGVVDAPGATITATASVSGGSATGGGGQANAPGATITATASMTGGAASAAAAYTITGYSGNAVLSTIDFTSKSVAAPLTYANNTQQSTNIYWNISPTPASAVSGWGTSNSTPPAEITQAANANSGSSINGMTPMQHPGAWSNQSNLWVTDGSGTSGPWYFWIKPVDGPAQCMNPAGTMATNA